MPTSLLDLVSELRDAPDLDRSSVERAIGASLSEAGGTGAYDFYEATDGLPGEAVSVELRAPKGTGPTLVVVRAEGCIELAEVRSRFSPLEVTQAPRGRSLDEETGHTLRDERGRVTFGFAERAPRCLSSVSIERDADES